MSDDSSIRRLVRRVVPKPVRAAIRRTRRLRRPMAPGERPIARDPARRGPNEPDGIARVHVGCGPKNLMPDWWNVDIRFFRGIDEVADVTVAWPWRDLSHVYGEHFLEHLAPDEALAFLGQARMGLRPGGRIRLSTPGLEWVWRTHFRPDGSAADVIAGTYRANRAFHGWGHRFLYSRPFLEHVLAAAGFSHVRFLAYGESDDPALRGLERHGAYEIVDGWPNVWNVEATRPPDDGWEPSSAVAEEIEQEFARYVRAGH
jgi:predicted SAM-dependent methyltransferase